MPMPAAYVPELFDPIAWWAQVDGARTAVIDAGTGVRVSYRALHADAAAWHTLFEAHGVRPGDRVAILAQNRYEFLPLFSACLRSGAVLVPLNWRLTATELSRVMQDAEPVLFLGEDRFRGVAEEACARAGQANVVWWDLDRDVPPLLTRSAGHAQPVRVSRSPDDTIMLLYTSGSTGAPKGVMLPYRQVHWNAVATTVGWGLGASDVAPIATPFFHTGGWHVFTTTLLSRGGTVVLMGAFDPAHYLESIHQYGLTMSFGVPTQLDLLQHAPDWGRPLPSLRTFISGGATCPQRIKDMVRAAGYRIREGYGLTECGPNCFATNDRTAVEKDGTVGWPVPFLHMRLRDGDGRDVATGDIGELELRGPQLSTGYFNNPDATAKAFTADGWLQTGDLASVDDEGVFRIRGRRKEMFISGGENVFPGEVETALLDCAGVLEACVVAVPHPRWGEVGCAAVVRRDTTVHEQALVADVRQRLAGYKVPRHVVFCDALPRLGSGKIDRYAVATLVNTTMAARTAEQP